LLRKKLTRKGHLEPKFKVGKVNASEEMPTFPLIPILVSFLPSMKLKLRESPSFLLSGNWGRSWRKETKVASNQLPSQLERLKVKSKLARKGYLEPKFKVRKVDTSEEMSTSLFKSHSNQLALQLLLFLFCFQGSSFEH